MFDRNKMIKSLIRIFIGLLIWSVLATLGALGWLKGIEILCHYFPQYNQTLLNMRIGSIFAAICMMIFPIYFVMYVARSKDSDLFKKLGDEPRRPANAAKLHR